MSEWWTYRLSDFLLFSPRTYYRLTGLYNEAIWPGQLLAVAVGLAIAWMLWRPTAGRIKAATVLLAAAWLWVAWAYLVERYSTINWAAVYVAAAFALQGLLLAGVAVLGRLGPALDTLSARLGLALFGFALVAHPLIGPLAGRPFSQAEIFGLMPDPTSIGTLGVLVGSAGASRWLLLPIPIAWCLLSGATLWTMNAPEALVPPLAAVVAVGSGLAGGRRARA